MGVTPSAWRWSGGRRSKVAVATATLAAVVASSTMASAFTVADLSAVAAQFDAKYGADFTAWNTTRNILRTEVGIASGTGDIRKAGFNGAGIDVALIDTGVAPVKGLNTADAVINGPDLSLDRQAGMPASVDGYGHGTHLAGIIAGRDAGLAPGSRLVNVKVGSADGAVDVSQVIAAIDWVVTNRNANGLNIRVLNLAYGTDSTQGYRNSPLTHAVESAWRAGIVVVVSAGNTGGPLANPATDPFVLTVGAADINDPYKTTDDVVAPYSAVGTTARGVDLLAPGTSITSLRVPGGIADLLYPDSKFNFLGTSFAKASGTSQAAAVVSGAAALILDARPELNPDQVKRLLTSTARPIPGAAANAQGGGVLDVAKAFATPSPTPAAARQTFTVSTGGGKLDLARGTARLIADNGTVLAGEVDVLGAAWPGLTWAVRSTAGTAWNGGMWNGNTWSGSGYDANLTVDGVAWTGRSWRAAIWTARSWRADLWAARSWRSELWAGRSWRSDGWA